METLYSNSEDCRKLMSKIYFDIGNKMSIYGAINEVPTGKYHMIPASKYKFDSQGFSDDAVTFYYKCLKGHFIRVTISEELRPLSMGLKLAALSDFCTAISKYYGMPSFFYTVEGDPSVNLQWSFDHVKEDLASLRDGTYFDDATVDQLIEFKEPTNEKDKEKHDNSFRITGLPYELLDLIITYGPDFLNAKTGERLPKKEGKKDAREFN